MAKKLDAVGLSTLWGIIKNYVNDNKITVYGSVRSYSSAQSFAKNGLLIVNSDEVYVSNAQVTGFPSHVTEDDNEAVTDDNDVVTDRQNTNVKWDKIT
jgi:hypothetical protein